LSTGLPLALAISVVLSTSAGVGEEVLFRGLLQPAMATKLGATGGLLASSLVFGALHAATPRYLLLAFGLSAYLG
jgi:membrane protease YdiL (CAAX protease family)